MKVVSHHDGNFECGWFLFVFVVSKILVICMSTHSKLPS